MEAEQQNDDDRKRQMEDQEEKRLRVAPFVLMMLILTFVALVPWGIVANAKNDWCPVVSLAVSVLGFLVAYGDRYLGKKWLYEAGMILVAIGIAITAFTAYK